MIVNQKIIRLAKDLYEDTINNYSIPQIIKNYVHKLNYLFDSKIYDDKIVIMITSDLLNLISNTKNVDNKILVTLSDLIVEIITEIEKQNNQQFEDLINGFDRVKVEIVN